MTPRSRRLTPFELYLIYLDIGVIGLIVDGMHYFAQRINIMTSPYRSVQLRVISLFWVATVRQPETRCYRGIFTLKYVFIVERDKKNH